MLYNFVELWLYRPALSNKNGVVGKPGINIPNAPRNNEMLPSNINMAFVMLFITSKSTKLVKYMITGEYKGIKINGH